MKELFLTLIFSIFAFANLINWQTNLDNAINLAKKQNKNILVFITAASCPYCELMEQEIFNDKEGVNYLGKSYVFVKLNLSDAQKIFKDVYLTPTTYFITPKKEILASQVGYQNEEFFYYTVGNAERKFKELKGK
jgi:thiol-disulfide isomerase/thioredoxin